MAMKAPTERFGNRVDNYAKYRPQYPGAMLEFIRRVAPLSAIVADIGSGTGILTKQLLSAGFEVYAIEPNDPMRSEAERSLSVEPLFHSVKGSAESTSLPDRSMDFITSAQAFHWFDRGKAKPEFQRILRPGRWTALIWNERQVDTSTFSWKYEELLRNKAPEYRQVDHRNVSAGDISAFFEPGQVIVKKFPNAQQLGREAFIGRVLSSSYVPLAGEPGHRDIVASAERLFDERAVEGTVSFEYETMLYLGRFGRVVS
jgi:ubiquinone/menaquinone biosynthesis C-methylase UbiE